MLSLLKGIFILITIFFFFFWLSRNKSLELASKKEQVFDRIWKRAILRIRDLCLKENASYILAYLLLSVSAQKSGDICTKSNTVLS